MENSKVLIYLSDLVHNFLPGSYTIPLSIAYVTAYAMHRFGPDVEIKLYKYADTLLNDIKRKKPDLLGFSNYTWNYELNSYVGHRIKQSHAGIPIVMGGPNIRSDKNGIASYLNENSYVDVYCMFEGEIPFSHVLERLLSAPINKRNGLYLRRGKMPGCFSMFEGELNGEFIVSETNDLDWIPSPYTTHVLDAFFNAELIPVFESNRGCPYSCSYCNWGRPHNKKIKRFSMTRIKSDMKYVAQKSRYSAYWIMADANFGILKRDVEIAQHLRRLHEKYRPFNRIQLFGDKQAADNIVNISSELKGLTFPYIAFQSFDPDVLRRINRTNISDKKLHQVSEAMRSISSRFHTDILLGLPGETTQSHLRSLATAIELGFNSIDGGEVHLLKGSQLETDSSRQRNGIKSKFRLVQEGFGFYGDDFVIELEECIRSTNWITENEMLDLRILRAMFYSCVTLAEFLPLVKLLEESSLKTTEILDKMLRSLEDSTDFSEIVFWLKDKACSEWFDSRDNAKTYYANQENREKLLENPTIKLNYDFLSHLMLSEKRYDTFCSHMVRVLSRELPEKSIQLINDFVSICKNRNYVLRCLRGNYDTVANLRVTGAVLEKLLDMGFVHGNGTGAASEEVKLVMDEERALLIQNGINNSGKLPTTQQISILVQNVQHIHMQMHI